MDVVKLQVPYSFIRGRFRLRWCDVLFGLRNELLDPEAPIQMALACLEMEETAAPPLVQLASLLKPTEDCLQLVQALCDHERPALEEEVRSRWLCISLAWVFEHKSNYADPLRVVEEIYADFDYPKEIAHFVRYMPMARPDAGSSAANLERMFSDWQEFVAGCVKPAT
jgi:hypothetical protein